LFDFKERIKLSAMPNFYFILPPIKKKQELALRKDVKYYQDILFFCPAK